MTVTQTSPSLTTLTSSQFDAAIAAAQSDAASPEEKAEMLMEIAMGMQAKPKTPDQLHQAVALYDRALASCPADAPLLQARIRARQGTALQALPDGGISALHKAEACYEQALPVLRDKAKPEEAAEAEMNLGLVLQAMAPSGQARIHDAIQCYHRSLRVFVRERWPQEFAILHNNLAIAYLSIPLSDERSRMREALAVQSFEEVLKVVSLVDHPSEYAMIQNNLGNALQYASSGHPLDNNLRALVAYDEALKVRNERDTPLEYANTICNRANVLRNLPQDPDEPLSGRRGSLQRARALYGEAQTIFERLGQAGNAAVAADALAGIAQELADASATATVNGNGNGNSNSSAGAM
jgi:tetratricopeptide (TPR) repeat protein